LNWEEYKRQIAVNKRLPEDWYILGIDLGTTNSVVSYWDAHNSRPEEIDVSNGFGKVPLPSVVQYRADEKSGGEWVVGEEAYRSMKIYPESTVRSVKRQMGTVRTVMLNNKQYAPEQISAKILEELIKHVKGLNPKAEIAGAVVSVPYDFDDAAKKATMRACELAGLSDKLICLMEEPKAAALAYNFRRKLERGEKIMVFDFGGGTLDITVFHVAESEEARIKLQVISEGGEAYHGGDNIDETILEKCYAFIYDRTTKQKESFSPENQAELIMRAREAKERLSGVRSYRIPFTFCIPPFVEQFTRDEFIILIKPFIEKTKRLVLKTLREAYARPLTPNDVGRVLMEGGSCQMPWVKEMLTDIFGGEDKIYTSERPALDISLGATYYAAMKMGLLAASEMESERAGVEFEITVPHDVGLELDNGGRKSFYPMIRRGTTYALAKKSRVFTLSGAEPSDMTTLDLKIMERIDREASIEDCKLIGEVLIRGLPERPSGKTRLEVTLSVEEESGIVNGSVADLGNGDEYPASGFKQNFDPSRFIKTVLKAP